MKAKKLQKRLIKLGAVFSLILILVVAAYFFIDDKNDSIAQQVSSFKSETAAVENKYKTLQRNLHDSQKAVDRYKDFSTSRDGSKDNFHRDFARNLLASLRDKDGILELEFSMEPFTKASAAFERPTVALFQSKVAIKFSADTDIDVFNLVKDISQSFPGYAEILSFELERKSEITDETLIAIGEGKSRSAFVEGNITFEWQGIQDNLDYKKSAEPGFGSVGGSVQ